MSEIQPDFSSVIRVESQAPHEMLSIRIEGTKTVVRINSSSLGVIQTCPRKSMYVLHERWRAKQGAPALIYGHAYHKALEVFYTYPGSERSIPHNFTEHADLIGRGYAAPEEHFLYDAVKAFVADAQPLAALPDDDKRSIPSGIWSLSHYFNSYINDNYVIHRDAAGPVIERPFTYVIFESATLRIELFGTIDFILRNTITGEILPGDHKTTSMMGNDFMARVKPNHQYTGYLLAAQQVLGIESQNFLVNGIEVKAKPKTARGGPPKFIRQITRRTEEDMTEFRHVVTQAVSDYLGWKDAGLWPLGPVDACSMWGGCQYHDVCAAPFQLRDNILNSKFQKEQNA